MAPQIPKQGPRFDRISFGDVTAYCGKWLVFLACQDGCTVSVTLDFDCRPSCGAETKDYLARRADQLKI